MRTVMWIALLATTVARMGLGQEATSRFAVLPFENTGSYGQDREVFEGLELGLPALLSRAIDRHPAADAVGRQALDAAMRGLNVGAGQRVDAATAAQVGKQAGARYTVTGSFADFYGKFRINARLVDARTAEIVAVVSNEDPKLQDRAQLAGIVQTIAERLTSAAGLSAYPSGTAPMAIPTDAITAFSRGLLHETRGDRAKATEFYRTAVTGFPQFEDAKEGLSRVGTP